jgi:alpha-N-acetylglucosamine transferase
MRALSTSNFHTFLIAAVLFSGLIYFYVFSSARTTSTLDLLPSSQTTWAVKQSLAYATFLGSPTSHIDRDRGGDEEKEVDVLKDPYFNSVRLLNYQIQHAGRTRTQLEGVPFLVLVLSTVPESQIATLKAEGAALVHIKPLDLPDTFDKDFIETSRFRDVLAKLRLWQLTEYDKILYLDADSFLLRHLDGLFSEPELKTLHERVDNTEVGASLPDEYLMAASTDTYGSQLEWENNPEEHPAYLCACFMLIKPSLILFEYYLSILNSPNPPVAIQNAAYPEQDLLIYAHRLDGPIPWKRIPIEWSANDGEMNDVLALKGGVRSLHVKGWEDAEGGNVAGEKYSEVWRALMGEMEGFYADGKNTNSSD